MQQWQEQNVDFGSKKPQQAQPHATVVPGTAHHRVRRVAKRAKERVAVQATPRLHVPDGGLDGTVPVDHCLQRARHASPLA